MSLLTIVQQAMLRQGQAAPGVVIHSGDSGVQQRIALLQDIGDELDERYTWQTMNQPAQIVCDGVLTLFPLPPDWGGMSEGTTIQSTKFPTLPVLGQITNEQFAAFQALPVAPLQPLWRVRDNQFEFYPTPAAGEIYKYTYYSNQWIQSALGVPQSVWLADTDISLIDEKVLVSGLEWRWLKSKGLDYAEEFRRYEMRLGRAAGRSTNAREVTMSSRRFSAYPTWPGQLPVYDGTGEEGII